MTAHSHLIEEAGNQGVGASALPTGLSSLRDEAAKASSPEASIPSRVSDVLDRAAGTLAADGAWTQGAWARDERGYAVSHDAHGAKCWCLDGALMLAKGQADTFDEIIAIEALLPDVDAIHWNDADGRTQVEVVAKLREAAALARGQGK